MALRPCLVIGILEKKIVDDYEWPLDIRINNNFSALDVAFFNSKKGTAYGFPSIGMEITYSLKMVPQIYGGYRNVIDIKEFYLTGSNGKKRCNL